MELTRTRKIMANHALNLTVIATTINLYVAVNLSPSCEAEGRAPAKPVDLDRSCYVDWGDFAVFSASWLACNDPQNMPPCTAIW